MNPNKTTITLFPKRKKLSGRPHSKMVRYVVFILDKEVLWNISGFALLPEPYVWVDLVTIEYIKQRRSHLSVSIGKDTGNIESSSSNIF